MATESPITTSVSSPIKPVDVGDNMSFKRNLIRTIIVPPIGPVKSEPIITKRLEKLTFRIGGKNGRGNLSQQ